MEPNKRIIGCNVNSSVSIRNATTEDLVELAELFNQYRIFYQKPSDVNLARNFLADRLHRKESVVFIAGIDGGEAIGFAQLYPIFSSISATHAWVLNDLFVAPKWRQQGVAKALLNEVLTYGKSTDAAWINLQTATDNLIAQTLYKRSGFTHDQHYLTFTHSLLDSAKEPLINSPSPARHVHA